MQKNWLFCIVWGVELIFLHTVMSEIPGLISFYTALGNLLTCRSLSGGRKSPSIYGLRILIWLQHSESWYMIQFTFQCHDIVFYKIQHLKLKFCLSKTILLQCCADWGIGGVGSGDPGTSCDVPFAGCHVFTCTCELHASKSSQNFVIRWMFDKWFSGKKYLWCIYVLEVASCYTCHFYIIIYVIFNNLLYLWIYGLLLQRSERKF